MLPLNSAVIQTDISDHYTIAVQLNDNSRPSKRWARNYSNKCKNKFTADLQTADWSKLYSIQLVDKAFAYFINKLKRIYNKSFPFTQFSVTNKKPLWLTSAILKSIRHKNKLFIQSKTNPELKESYASYRNQLNMIIRNAKLSYHCSLLNNFKNNSTKLWAHLNSLLNPRVRPEIPVTAEVLNNFFMSVYQQAPNPLANLIHTIPNNQAVLPTMYLSPVTYDEIINIIPSLSNSHAVGYDGINPIIVKSNLPYLANQLTCIFNLSFEQYIFPKQLKKAVVTPIFKSGKSNDPSNYRPISILSIFSKLLEKLFYNRLFNFVTKHHVLHPNQFGFQPNKSTSLAIANVLSTLLNKINSNKHIAFVLFDLKKAFDLINHRLLLTKLQHYGIRGAASRWLSNYLSDRSQIVKCNGVSSSQKLITTGTPQGSILSTLIFILFINDIFQLSLNCIDIFLYADDTAVIISCDSDTELQAQIDLFVCRYLLWCDKNCIVLNPAKSEFLTFNASNIHVSVNGHILINPSYVKYLGILIDDKLEWKHHVSHVTKVCSQRIGMFKKILPYLPKFAALMYYNCFIKSAFSYCIMFWFGNDRSGRYKLIDKIDHVINYFANAFKCDTSQLICDMKICNTLAVYKLQSLSFMYDVMHNVIILPHCNLNLNANVHGHHTRSSVNLHIDSITSMERRNFLYRSLLLWNSCDVSSRLIMRKSVFIASCKTSIFNSV